MRADKISKIYFRSKCKPLKSNLLSAIVLFHSLRQCKSHLFVYILTLGAKEDEKGSDFISD